MKYLLILNIFLYISIKETGVEAKVTCRSGVITVTGDGDACCTLKFYSSESVYRGSVVPYDSKTQSCCMNDTFYSGSITITSGKIVNDISCCLDMRYDNKTQICCNQYSESARTRTGRLGYGDSCCGPNSYNKTTHGCCPTFLPVADDYIYMLYNLTNSCCKFGEVHRGNACYPASDKHKNYPASDKCKNNNALLLRSKTIYFIFIFIFFII